MLDIQSQNQFSRFFWSLVVLALFLILIGPKAAAYIPGITGLLCAGFLYIRFREKIQPDFTELGLFTAIVLLAGLSSFWAPDPEFAQERTVKIAIILLPGLLFVWAARITSAQIKPKIILVLAGVFILAGFVYGLEALLDYPLVRMISARDDSILATLNRNTVILSLLYLPLTFLVHQTFKGRRKLKIILCAALSFTALWAILPSQSQSAQLTFFVSLIFFSLFYWLKTRALWGLFGLIVIIAIAAPFVLPPLKDAVVNEEMSEISPMMAASVPHRLQIWSFVSEKALEKPFKGHGIEATRFLRADQEMSFMRSREAMHPHNGVLQLWIEFGMTGIGLMLIFLGYLFWRIAEASRDIRPLYVGVLMGVLSLTSTGYGLWQSWQLGFFLILAGFCIAISRQINILKD